MFKEKLELMNTISAKKKEIRECCNSWSMDQVNAAKADLAELQAKFDLMADIDDEVIEEAPKEQPATNDAIRPPAVNSTTSTRKASARTAVTRFRKTSRQGLTAIVRRSSLSSPSLRRKTSAP